MNPPLPPLSGGSLVQQWEVEPSTITSSGLPQPPVAPPATHRRESTAPLLVEMERARCTRVVRRPRLLDAADLDLVRAICTAEQARRTHS